ncbi:MAG: activase, partial [Treponema sp.]|nr:activase [Treponema sp.]
MALLEGAHLWAGIDIGSTTTKLVVYDPTSKEILHSQYKRHHAAQKKSVLEALKLLDGRFPNKSFKLAMTGSGSKPISKILGLPFVQEVVANSIALKKNYPNVNTAIELGGQDAKMIFFSREDGQLKTRDMRMNGSCAGGTGAFIDEVASILKVPIEDFDNVASRGKCVYDISGRCGVYAKTDIQPLLNSGIAKEDLALSAFHAIAKQTIGGLSQGLDILPPVAFEGGPLTFNKSLVKVFVERLNLAPDQVIIPEHPETIIALGAALSIEELFSRPGFEQNNSVEKLIALLEENLAQKKEAAAGAKPFFDSEEEKEKFFKRHEKKRPKVYTFAPGESVRPSLGIDSGSTTTKFVLLDEDKKIIDWFYAGNEGDPLVVAKKALIEMRERYKAQGVDLKILGAGSTGYGELLFNKAFNTDYHVVETVAHAKAASHYIGDADFILDIGGQDMKAIWLSGGIITNILVNEACSSGCGSFLQNFADTLGIKVQDIAAAAFESKSPAILGSRCTVFMTSSIVTEQRNGKLPQDIMAGLCRSIIQNVFTKVIRVSNIDSLGKKIVVQGGTFQNDAVLRTMEEYTGKEVYRAPYPGIMGAIGAALLTKEKMEKSGEATSFIGLDALDGFSYEQETNVICPFCANHCKRTLVKFSNGARLITNNRCERGEILGDPKDAAVVEQIKEQKIQKAPNLFKLRQELLFKDYRISRHAKKRGITFGLPRVLSFWETAPFWTTLLRSMGFDVKLS